MVMNENKFRKQSREESQTKIEDEAIKPYVIYFDGFSYTVVKPKEKGQDENLYLQWRQYSYDESDGFNSLPQIHHANWFDVDGTANRIHQSLGGWRESKIFPI